MKALIFAAVASLALCAVPLSAQDEEGGYDDGGGEQIVVTGSLLRRGDAVAIPAPPVIGIKRQADSALRNIEIISDSRDEDMRRREVQAMLLDAIDRAKKSGFSLVTGQLEVREVTRANWRDRFPGLASKDDSDDDDDDDDDDYDDDDDKKPKPEFEDDGSITKVRLKIKTKLDGSISNAAQKIGSFVKTVPANGRSQIQQKGDLALTIISPEQYRDELYRRIAAGAKHAVSFYGTDYSLAVTGLDKAVAWKQVSNTELFIYIPYDFSVKK